MSSANATGHVRIIERRGGPVAYAKLKLPDGREPQRRLGRLWTTDVSSMSRRSGCEACCSGW
jgi:hypothetical protein